MKIAHVCTPHGFGHLTRQLALGIELEHLCASSTYYCHNASIVKESHPNAKYIVKSADVGLIQKDSLHIDFDQTLRVLDDLCTEKKLQWWMEELAPYDAVIADLPPIILEACRRIQKPVLAVGNFDWAWIYRHYQPLKNWSKQWDKWQKGHVALSLSPGPAMEGFTILDTVSVISRPAEPYPVPSNGILLSFGGLGLADLNKIPRFSDVLWILTPATPYIERPDFRYISDVPYQNLIEGSEILLSKAGYSILSESMRSGTKQIWLHRSQFPEAPYLEEYAQQREDILLYEDLVTPTFADELMDAIQKLRSKKTARIRVNEVSKAAQCIFQFFQKQLSH
ncbi:MAG: hypothetical protein VX278_05700 [Myxococcota bacterium]|nr:hypothetical protein [Myxococcota bacterium]